MPTSRFTSTWSHCHGDQLITRQYLLHVQKNWARTLEKLKFTFLLQHFQNKTHTMLVRYGNGIRIGLKNVRGSYLRGRETKYKIMYITKTTLTRICYVKVKVRPNS